MCVIVWIVRVDCGGTRVLVQIGRVEPVVDKGRARISRRILRVSHESIGRVRESASLPDVVRSGAADDHIGAFGLKELCGVDQVGVVRLDGLGLSTVPSSALISSAENTIALTHTSSGRSRNSLHQPDYNPSSHCQSA